jgi:hypothetical protein
VSLRADILGWVIRRLSEIDGADPVARAALFETLRAETAANGACGAPADLARPHLESAIARQDVYWMTQEAPRPAAPAAPLPPPPASAPQPDIWQWPRNLPPIGPPPGPPPGDATGPFADHVYQTVRLAVPGSVQDLHLGWAFDPACSLTAHCPAIGFDFRTRAATFADAAEHLARVLKQGGLDLPAKVRALQDPA